MNIFVSNLHNITDGDDLEELFSEYGKVKSAKVIFDRETGRSKNYGFVEMENEEEGKKAIEALNESIYDSCKIVVKLAKPKKN